MDNLHIYSVGGDTVVLSAGVREDTVEMSSREILKGNPLSVQAGFVRSTEIKIPRFTCAGEYFSADCALCFGYYLRAQSAEQTEAFTLSSSGLDTPVSVSVSSDGSGASLALAGRAKTSLTGALPSVIFGGCEYFIAQAANTPEPQALLETLCEGSHLRQCALLVKSKQAITPYFSQKSTASCGFSAGSAALALAFFESEQSRDFFKAAYRFPGGERKVEMKRFLSEAFEAQLTATVRVMG